MLVVGYARESTKKTEQQTAFDWQVQRLREYGCDRIFSDRMSGASRKRPGYKEMMEFVKSGQVSEVVVTSLTRMGRSLQIVIEAVEVFQKHGVKFTALDGSIDLTTAAGRAMLNTQAVFAQLEREIIIERISEGFEGARQNKRPIRAPFAYLIVEGELKINEEVEAIARELRQRVVRDGLTKACQWLNENYSGLPKAPRTPGGIQNWLKCETLYGHLQYFRHKDPIIYRNQHEALFTEKERAEVMEAIAERKRHHGFKQDPVRFPFTGLCYCAACGASMSVSYHANRPFDYRDRTWYRCYKALRKLCSNKGYVRVRKIEEAIHTELLTAAEKIADRVARAQQGPTKNPQIDELEAQLKGLQMLPSNPHIEQAIAGIKADIAHLEAQSTKVDEVDEVRLQTLRMTSKKMFWERIEPESRQQLYRTLVKGVYCLNGEVDRVDLWV